MERLELYTFGNAANHFSDPPIRTSNAPIGEQKRVVKHIEHYANLGDYVSLFGILHFRPLPMRKGQKAIQGGRLKTQTSQNRGENANGKAITTTTMTREVIENTYIGRLFVRKGSGHQMNGNYLDNFFAMNSELTHVLEDNEFMDSELNEEIFESYDIASRASEKDVWECKDGGGKRQIKEVCRLWKYRNGMSPENS